MKLVIVFFSVFESWRKNEKIMVFRNPSKNEISGSISWGHVALVVHRVGGSAIHHWNPLFLMSGMEFLSGWDCFRSDSPRHAAWPWPSAAEAHDRGSARLHQSQTESYRNLYRNLYWNLCRNLYRNIGIFIGIRFRAPIGISESQSKSLSEADRNPYRNHYRNHNLNCYQNPYGIAIGALRSIPADLLRIRMSSPCQCR